MNRTQLLAVLRRSLEDRRARLLRTPGVSTVANPCYGCVCGVALMLGANQIDHHITWHENEEPHLLWWRLRLLHPYLPVPARDWRSPEYNDRLSWLHGALCAAKPTYEDKRAIYCAIRFVGKEKQLLRRAGFDLPRHGDSRSFILMREPELRFVVDLFLAGETAEGVSAVFQDMAHVRESATEAA